MKRYYLLTFGCQMNQSDSERIERFLKDIGYQSASNIDEADLVIINMCSVRQSAVNRVYGRIRKIRELKEKKRNLKTLITGCVLKTDLNKLKKDFDYILSIRSLPYWKEILENKPKFVYFPAFNKQKLGIEYLETMACYQNKFSAFVPISTGCNEFCSYCVVPYTRGPLVSRPPQQILKEVRSLVKEGFKEIWLLGQNVNSYQFKKTNFAQLLRKINKIPGKFWISFTSSHPKDFSDEIIQAIAECEKINKYISLPVQSGDDEILKKMNRPYTVKQYKQLVKKIRKAIPGVAISTDIIVGFPGETKKHFQNTKKLFKELEFDMAYIAEYSPRPGTAASKLEDDVPPKEKQRRREELTEILKKISLKKSKRYVGQRVEVLVHEISKNKFLIGKTRFYKTVKIPCQNCSQYLGQIIEVEIIDFVPWGLKGRMVS
jgi:tRNA-2-methylthio-N6-dimethylallyladenosine synthase